LTEITTKSLLAIVDKLDAAYPDARQELNFETPFQLLIATILAAQSTDARVNRVTEGLFKKYPTPQAFVDVDISQLEEDIRSTGFYRNKAKNVKACCAALLEKHNGAIPPNVEKLITLPGVGRKTANIVLSNAMGIPAIGVDTHTLRVSNRIGVVSNIKNPDKIEQKLCELLPEEKWHRANILIQWHGRYTCKAKKPDCTNCAIYRLCNWEDKSNY